MTQSITHRNHYIPRFYLKNWSLDGKRTLAKKLFNKVLSFFNKKVKIKYRRGCYVVGGGVIILTV